ncbi:MAG: type II toxin-antitoxin system RelE/ParE family toxin [Candidatus Longimicrobiales bacterium M2_2A_002]
MYRVKVEQEAKENLRAHYLNLQKQFPGSEYPREWYRGIRTVILDWATSADRCGPAYEDRYFRENIRHRLYDPYKVPFTIRSDLVHVLHIRHQSQDPEDFK